MAHDAVYATLLTKTEYLPGALVLEDSLRSVGSIYPLVIMITPTVPKEVRDVLHRRGIQMVEIDPLQPEEGVHAVAEHDARFADTWTKLRCFDLFEYQRVVLLDSDMIVMKNMDELMELDLPRDWIAAGHACACNPRKLAHYPADWVPENCAHTSVAHPTAGAAQITETSPRPYTLLNSGLVVLSPSPELSAALRHYLATSPLVPTFSFPDQDLLAAFFKGKWKPLPWYYNALKTLRVIHKPLWEDSEIRCLHYILADKPWKSRKDAGDDYDEVHRWWWERFAKLGESMQTTDTEGWKLLLANVAPAEEI